MQALHWPGVLLQSLRCTCSCAICKVGRSCQQQLSVVLLCRCLRSTSITHSVRFTAANSGTVACCAVAVAEFRCGSALLGVHDTAQLGIDCPTTPTLRIYPHVPCPCCRQLLCGRCHLNRRAAQAWQEDQPTSQCTRRAPWQAAPPAPQPTFSGHRTYSHSFPPCFSAPAASTIHTPSHLPQVAKF